MRAVRAVRAVRSRPRCVRGAADSGSAVIEFVFLAVTVLVPLVYLVVAVAVVQRSGLAVTNAAREAGRGFATADTVSQGQRNADLAVRLALEDQGMSADDARLRVVPIGASCTDSPVGATLLPGAEYTVCVTRQAALPGIPSMLAGRGITTVGRFSVHVDDFRSSG